ncbi:hypothetical protein M422DRAFT_780558 [Sphaerobolus stellatus SS14]|uniref:Unplaced genomic scaffold SPHSTscaffold_65, whole genome shotgun sequence n=1 Tax=Sphaerobolus stellatus (strain SS14) TaxID=990650 RepID=A0A0C9VS88_SPHS4|nr:hypothetical protein M422DRAFT_780558 [Sphaerobolus stellatus SS14]
MAHNCSLVWFVTGASTGLGLSIVRKVLERNDRVIATTRTPSKAKELAALQSQYPSSCEILQLDLTWNFTAIRAQAEAAIKCWGKVDVVLNNAALSLAVFSEEAGASIYEEVFKSNVFGPVNVANAFLPHLRERKTGTLVFTGSRSGWKTARPVSVLYASSKSALHAIADGLSVELAPFNIKVLNVIPGGLRTSGIDNMTVVRGEQRTLFTEAYSRLTESPPNGHAHASESSGDGIRGYDPMYRNWMELINSINGKQPGDPDESARTIVDVVREEGLMRIVNEAGEMTDQLRAWPGTLYLGSDAVEDVRQRCTGVLETLEVWKEIAGSIDIKQSPE